MATGEPRIVPTLDDLIAQRGSRLEATVQRARYFERIRPPNVDQGSPIEGMATLEPGPSVDCDDLLDRAPDVRILFVGGVGSNPGQPPVDLRRPHENIEGLIAWRKLTPQAIAMLPSLRFLQLAGQSATTELQAAFPSTLEEIWSDSLDLEGLSRLLRLRYLRTPLRAGGAAQSEALAALSELRTLHLEVLEALRGTSALGRLEHLEDFSINSVSSLNFEAFAGCRRLKYLRLGGLGSTKTLDGIERLEALESLSLAGRRCPPIGPLARLPNLEMLSLGSSQPPPDLEVIGGMTRLRSLSLSIGSVSSPYTLKGAALFFALDRLEGLQCLAHLADKDLSPLARLKRLKYLCFYGTFPEEAVRRLQEQLPDCKLDLTTGEAPPARAEIKVGLLTASREDDGTWSVSQDLRLILDHDDNHAAEDALRAHLKRTNPDALKRMVFDSERDGFAASVKTRDDLEQLATAVAALAAATESS